MSGRRLAAALAAIALLAFVLPPLVANQVHGRRIDRSREAAVELATALAAESAATLVEVVGPTGRDSIVLAGPGANPTFAPGLGWPADRLHLLNDVLQRLASRQDARRRAAIDASPDPWGNQYLVVIRVGSASSVTVLSAGPNGTIETPFAAVLTAQGDDIVSVR